MLWTGVWGVQVGELGDRVCQVGVCGLAMGDRNKEAEEKTKKRRADGRHCAGSEGFAEPASNGERKGSSRIHNQLGSALQLSIGSRPKTKRRTARRSRCWRRRRTTQEPRLPTGPGGRAARLGKTWGRTATAAREWTALQERDRGSERFVDGGRWQHPNGVVRAVSCEAGPMLFDTSKPAEPKQKQNPVGAWPMESWRACISRAVNPPTGRFSCGSFGVSNHSQRRQLGKNGRPEGAGRSGKERSLMERLLTDR
jgi:hypothetical protein